MVISFTISIAIFFAWNYPKKFCLNIENANNKGMYFNVDYCSITPKKISIVGWAFVKSNGRGSRTYLFLQNKKTDGKIEIPLRTFVRKDVTAKYNLSYDRVGFSAALNFLTHVDDYDNVVTIIIKDQNNNIFEKTYVCR